MARHFSTNKEPHARIVVEWSLRSNPLTPTAVAAWGAAGCTLAGRLLARGGCDGLTGVVADDLIVVIGASEDLPWADGVVYLGSEPSAPLLLMPTTLAPSVPSDILDRALSAHFGQQHLAVIPSITTVAPLGSARTIALDLLAVWKDRDRTKDDRGGRN